MSASRTFPRLAACLPGGRVKCAYIGSGLQLFVAGALPAWLPTYFNRYYELPVDKRGVAGRALPRHLRRRAWWYAA